MLCVVSAQSTSIPAVREELVLVSCLSQQQQWPGRVVSSSSTVVLAGAGGVITRIVERGWELQIFFDTKIL